MHIQFGFNEACSFRGKKNHLPVFIFPPGHLIKCNPAVVTIFAFNEHFVKIIVHVPFGFNQKYVPVASLKKNSFSYRVLY